MYKQRQQDYYCTFEVPLLELLLGLTFANKLLNSCGLNQERGTFLSNGAGNGPPRDDDRLKELQFIFIGMCGSPPTKFPWLSVGPAEELQGIAIPLESELDPRLFIRDTGLF